MTPGVDGLLDAAIRDRQAHEARVARELGTSGPMAAVMPPAPLDDAEPAEQEERPLPQWPRPMGEAAYHGLIGDIVRTIAPETESDPAALLLQALVALGNVIGRAAWWEVEATRHHLNLFMTLIGASAKGRKGTAAAHVDRLFTALVAEEGWARHCRVSGLSSGEGLIWQVRDPIEKEQAVKDKGRVTGYETVIEDPGVSDKRLLVTEAEFAQTLRVMGREGNTLSAIIRKAWDGGDLRTMTKSSPGRATAPHISIVGHITRTELVQALTSTEAANGFANRFLWPLVRRSKLLPDGGEPVDLARLVKALAAAVAAGKEAGELRRDPDAAELWRAIYRDLSADHPGLLGSVTARAEAQVMRVACLYAIADCVTEVRVEHLRAGLEVWRYCYDSARYVFGDSLGDPTADTILRALRQAGAAGLTRTDIIQTLFKRNTHAREITRALAVLRDAGLASMTTEKDTGGRHAERWRATSGLYDPTTNTTKGPGEDADSDDEPEIGRLGRLSRKVVGVSTPEPEGRKGVIL